jgi:hypothetical protein
MRIMYRRLIGSLTPPKAKKQLSPYLYAHASMSVVGRASYELGLGANGFLTNGPVIAVRPLGLVQENEASTAKSASADASECSMRHMALEANASRRRAIDVPACLRATTLLLPTSSDGERQPCDAALTALARSRAPNRVAWSTIGATPDVGPPSATPLLCPTSSDTISRMSSDIVTLDNNRVLGQLRAPPRDTGGAALPPFDAPNQSKRFQPGRVVSLAAGTGWSAMVATRLGTTGERLAYENAALLLATTTTNTQSGYVKIASYGESGGLESVEYAMLARPGGEMVRSGPFFSGQVPTWCGLLDQTAGFIGAPPPEQHTVVKTWPDA